MKIRINHDCGDVYKAGEIISADDLITSYIECCCVESVIDYISNATKENAIKFIADAWDINYDIV